MSSTVHSFLFKIHFHPLQSEPSSCSESNLALLHLVDLCAPLIDGYHTAKCVHSFYRIENHHCNYDLCSSITSVRKFNRFPSISRYFTENQMTDISMKSLAFEISTVLNMHKDSCISNMIREFQIPRNRM